MAKHTPLSRSCAHNVEVVLAGVSEHVNRAAARFGDAVAVVDEHKRLTFNEVGNRSNRLAHGLSALSPHAGSRTALLMANRAEFIEADFAIAKAAKVKVPINPRLVPEEREHIIRNSGADTIIVDRDQLEFACDMANDIGELRNVICLDPVPGSGHIGYESLLLDSSPTDPHMSRPPDDGSYMLYTSGTTGRPKGAYHTNHGRVAATINMLAEELDVPVGGAMLHGASLTHGSGSKILAYFIRGARNITMRSWDPDEFLRLVDEEGVTGSFLVPTMIAMLLESKSAARTSSLRSVTYGGAPMPPVTIERALDRFGPVFVQVYGSCEAPHPVFILRREDHLPGPGRERHLASMGTQVLQTEVKLVDTDGLVVEPGVPGELLVKGPNVMHSYWADPVATAEAKKDGWYHTGDIAQEDPDGFFSLVGRSRDLIISGGLNVYPAEVEAALQRHPDILEVAVIGVPDDKWGETVKAVVVRRPDGMVDEAALIDFSRVHLAGYKKPTSVDFVAELPKGPTGKVLKREIRESYWVGQTRAI